MSLADVVAAMGIPANARVERRIPKTVLSQNAPATPTIRRQLHAQIEELQWVAALKPNSIGVPAFKDETRDYLEISVLALSLRASLRSPRPIEQIHRAIPYPVALWTEHAGGVELSLAHKRRSLAETDAVVIEELHRPPSFDAARPDASAAAFLGSLAISAQPSANLFAFYTGWIDRITAFEAAGHTGMFAVRAQADEAARDRTALENLAAVQHEIAILRTQAKKERQMNRRVELNLRIKKHEAEAAALVAELGSEAP